MAAETLTVETMARMIRDGSGIVCLCLTDELADHLDLVCLWCQITQVSLKQHLR